MTRHRRLQATRRSPQRIARSLRNRRNRTLMRQLRAIGTAWHGHL